MYLSETTFYNDKSTYALNVLGRTDLPYNLGR